MRLIAGLLVGALLGWLLSTRVGVSGPNNQFGMAIGVGMLGMVVGGSLKRVFRRRVAHTIAA